MAEPANVRLHHFRNTKLDLTEEGIAYIHDKRFGNPKEIWIRLCFSELNFILKMFKQLLL